MAIYAICNNKSGTGKSYLSSKLSFEYARQNPDKKIIVIDLCPKADASSMILGVNANGKHNLVEIYKEHPRKTISGYIEDRVHSPYVSPNSGASYTIQVSKYNNKAPENLYLVAGDRQLERHTFKVASIASYDRIDDWRIVHLWIRDLIADIQRSLNYEDTCIFIDCSSDYSIYKELALTAADRLIIPFSVNSASTKMFKSFLSSVFGIKQDEHTNKSDLFLKLTECKMLFPKIYMCIGNRLNKNTNIHTPTFKAVSNDIGEVIWDLWESSHHLFCNHTDNSPIPSDKKSFRAMFQYEINDRNINKKSGLDSINTLVKHIE